MTITSNSGRTLNSAALPADAEEPRHQCQRLQGDVERVFAGRAAPSSSYGDRNVAPGRRRAPATSIDRFSVGFIEPVNVYTLADRATKYGLLFVALTFAAFFVFEILRRLPIHPVQYLLVGLALALFSLLSGQFCRSTSPSSRPICVASACGSGPIVGFYLCVRSA